MHGKLLSAGDSPDFGALNSGSDSAAQKLYLFRDSLDQAIQIVQQFKAVLQQVTGGGGASAGAGAGTSTGGSPISALMGSVYALPPSMQGQVLGNPIVQSGMQQFGVGVGAGVVPPSSVAGSTGYAAYGGGYGGGAVPPGVMPPGFPPGGGGPGGGVPVPGYPGGGPSPSPSPSPVSPSPYLNQQWASLGVGGQIAGMALRGGASLVGQGIGIQADMALRGGNPVTEQAEMGANAISLGIGTIAGIATGNPMAGAAVASGANSVLSPLSRYLSANESNRIDSNQVLMPVLGALLGPGAQSAMNYLTGKPGPNNVGGGLVPIMANSDSRFEQVAAMANTKFGFSNSFGKLSPAERAMLPSGTSTDIAATYSGIASGLYAGGVDPFSLGERHRERYAPLWNEGGQTPLDDFADAGRTLRSGDNYHNLYGGLSKTAIGAIKMQTVRYDEDESEALMRTRRLAMIVGTKAAPDVAKRIAEIYAAEPETGGNTLDTLARFGAQDTLISLRLNNNEGVSSVSPDTLRTVSAGLRSQDRALQMASLQARGSGAAQVDALRKSLDYASKIPGSEDSLTVANLKAQERDAQWTAYRQSDITGYDIPAARLEGDRARMGYLPFNPGNSMKLDASSIQLANRQIGVLNQRENTMRANGTLTEERELEITEQRERLKTQRAQSFADISEGQIERLPTYLQNAPEGGGKLSSWSLASLALGVSGSPIRAFGAINGQQKGRQEAFVKSLGLNEDDIGPFSRTQNFNDQTLGSGGSGQGNLNETNDLLRQLIAIQSNGGGRNVGSQRTSTDAAGSDHSVLYGQDLRQDTLYNAR